MFAASEAPLSAVEQTAYDLYSSAFSATTFDARFVVLMMALETLLEPEERAAEVVSHVDNLIEITTKARLPSDQRASLLGSLRYMRQESIGQAGRRLALRLGERRYMELEAPRFFTKCYELRSSLVHGSHPRPDRVLIESYLPHLEQLVADLLAGKLLEEGSATEE